MAKIKLSRADLIRAIQRDIIDLETDDLEQVFSYILECGFLQHKNIPGIIWDYVITWL